MHFHLPKPLHGWREFAGEVGIIVLGVLIALGAEQVMEEIHWRVETARVERSLRSEIQDSVDAAVERRAFDPCLRSQLLRLKAVATGARAAGPPIALVGSDRVLPDVYYTPWRPWPRATWESAISSNAFSHMSHDRLAAYAYTYTAIADVRAIIQQERAKKGILAVLSGKPTPEQRANVLAALTDLDRNRADILVASDTILGMAPYVGVSQRLSAEEVRRGLREYSWFKPVCEPAG